MRSNSLVPAQPYDFPLAKIWLPFVILCLLAFASISSQAQTVISYVDTSLVGSQKYVIRVDGQPFYLNDIYVPCDKLRYQSVYLFTMAQCATLVGQVAADGFNTVTIPISWWEVEPTKDNFDWTILDAYMTMVNQANIKMELEWLGSNSTGGVGNEGDSVNPVHLRTPDYVLYAPSYNSTATTSDYTIDSGHPYTLYAKDPNLLARETYVYSQVMAHIAAWDAANGSRHPIIGTQVENEFNDPNASSATDMITYINAVASAVKQSNYIIYTRTNVVDDTTKTQQRVAANELLRNTVGTNLDFVGIDNYSPSSTVIEPLMPVYGQNFPMIMENSGQNPFTVKLAALAGGEAMNTVDMCGSSTEGMFLPDSPGSCTTPAKASYVPNVIANTKMLSTDPVDLALNAHGQGLFVHNWANTGAATSGGTLGMTYTPASTNDVGVSIMRSASQIVLMNTGGGKFTYPSNFLVTSASAGYFDGTNTWVNQGSVSFTPTSITAAPFTTVLVTYTLPVPAAPTGLMASAVYSSAASLSWTAPAYAQTYSVGRSTVSGGPYTTIATGLSSTSYTDLGLTPGTTYYYVVSASNATGTGANSTELSVPITPYKVYIPNFSFETPAVSDYLYQPAGASWTFSGASPSGSGVTTNGGTLTSSASPAPDGVQTAFLEEAGTFSQPLSGLVPNASYTIIFSASQRQNNSQKAESFNIQVNGITVGSFAPPQTTVVYTAYSATFIATATTETLSFVGTNTNGGDNMVFIDNVEISQAPAPPTGLTSVSADNLVTLTWNASSLATSYHVKRGTVTGGPYTTIATTTTASYSDSTAVNGTTYYYVVSGLNQAGEGPNSIQASATPARGIVIVPNYSFETPSTTNYLFTPAGASWTFVETNSTNGSGITTNNAHYTSGNANAPDGVQSAFIQELGTITQTISGFTPGESYKVSFSASQRQIVSTGSGKQLAETFSLQINGTTIGSFAPSQSNTGYTPYAATFTATAASQTVAFVGTNTAGGNNTVFIDYVQIHGLDDVWIVNGNRTVSGITSGNGAAITSAGINGGGTGVAIDGSGDIWSINTSTNALSEVSSTGTLLNGTVTGGAMSSPQALAIDGQGYIWVANGNNTISVMNSANDSAVSSTAYTGTVSSPSAVAVDGSGNLWIASTGDNSITKVVGVAAPVATPQASAVTNNKVAARP